LEQESKDGGSSKIPSPSGFSIRSFLRDFESQVQDECNLIFDTVDLSQEWLICVMWDEMGKRIRCKHSDMYYGNFLMGKLHESLERREALLQVGFQKKEEPQKTEFTNTSSGRNDVEVDKMLENLNNRVSKLEQKLSNQGKKVNQASSTDTLVYCCCIMIFIHIVVILKSWIF
jgi:hypothetical protein